MIGGLFTGIPLLLATTLASAGSMALFAVIAVAALTLGYRRGISAYWMSLLRTGQPGAARNDEDTDWIVGGTPGSSGGGSSDAGGSFSGGGFSSSGGGSGGGSSGGGGASGRW